MEKGVVSDSFMFILDSMDYGRMRIGFVLR